MNVLGIYGSSRRCGNSDILLDRALCGAERSGAEVTRIYASSLHVAGCIACGGCEKVRECFIHDDMDMVYREIDKADHLIVSTPIYFYSVPSQLKAIMDRSQLYWNNKPEPRMGRAHLIMVGATWGKELFKGAALSMRYWFETLGFQYGLTMELRGIDGRGVIMHQPNTLIEAFELGVRCCTDKPNSYCFN